jgi:hypothetical protein
MGKLARATLTMKGWEEKTYWEGEGGRKLTHVDAGFSYEGDMKGEGSAVWLLSYNPDGTGGAPAVERFAGSVGGRAGSFVMQHSSEFDPKAVRDRFFIIPGSGTGELAGIAGNASIEMLGYGPYEFTLEYDL